MGYYYEDKSISYPDAISKLREFNDKQINDTPDKHVRYNVMSEIIGWAGMIPFLSGIGMVISYGFTPLSTSVFMPTVGGFAIGFSLAGVADYYIRQSIDRYNLIFDEHS